MLRGPSAAPQKTGTPALSSLLIKAHENVQSSHRSQPGMVKRSAPQHQSSRTPGSRLISSAFCFRGHTGKGTQADCHNSPQCSLCSGSPFHVIPGVYIHTQSMFGNDYIFVYKFLWNVFISRERKCTFSWPIMHSALTLLWILMTKVENKGVNVHIFWQQKVD